MSYGAATADNWTGGTATADTTPLSAPGTSDRDRGQQQPRRSQLGCRHDNIGVTGYHIERCQAGCTRCRHLNHQLQRHQRCRQHQLQLPRPRQRRRTVNLGPYSNTATATTTASTTTGLQIVYRSTDADGVATYDVTSADNGYGTQELRVLAPTNPAPGVAHNFLYVLPVEAGLATSYGDGFETLRALDAQDQYNLTIIEPSFAIEPWYADNPTDPNLQYETFMTKDLLPWVTQNLAVTGHEQNWLIGFSKSGIGGEDLILKHPDLFTLAASWDFPADMSTYDQYGSSSADSYGTDANFQANYRLTPAFVDAHKAAFLSSNRIWIGGYAAFQTDVSDYDTLLISEGIAHTTETPQSDGPQMGQRLGTNSLGRVASGQH